MTETLQVGYTTFHGPSLAAPFAAVVAEFAEPVGAPVPVAQLAAKLATFIPPALMRRVVLPPDKATFAQLAAALAVALQDLHGRTGLDVRLQRLRDGVCRILLAYHDAQASMMALEVGLELATAFFNEAGGRAVQLAPIEQRMRTLAAVMLMRQPDPAARALIRVARTRHIPVYPVSPGSRIWLYGQGRAGFHGFGAASQQDSLIGFNLAHNKLLASQLVVQLGFPGTAAAPITTVAEARARAREIGWPVVIKPNVGREGKGVTAHITTDEELVTAFDTSNRIAPGSLLIERHVSGDDHRMTVLDGKLIWVSRLSPPSVTGDGKQSIKELIDTENQERRKSPIAEIASVQLTIDAGMLALLAKQGFRPDDRPPAGVRARLRTTANIARGGTLEDCTAAVHPDNRAMAETLARCFHLDAAGIDFVTPDIGRSWRQVDCAVIEINATPGFSSDERATQIMAARFPPGCDGRIPTVVLVGADQALLARAGAVLQAMRTGAGITDNQWTQFDGQPRFADSATLAERVRGLLLDPGCDALLIGVTPAEIEARGFPLDHCSLALVGTGTGLSAALRTLIEACAGRVVSDVTDANIEQALAGLP